MQGINDGTNILGLATLISDGDTADLNAIESEILKGKPADKKELSISDQYKKQMAEIENVIGLKDRKTYDVQSNVSNDLYRPKSPSKSVYSFGAPEVIDLTSEHNNAGTMSNILQNVNTEENSYQPRYTREYNQQPTTNEQIHKSALDSLIGSEEQRSTNEYSLDQMNEEDDKANLLENIDTLIQTLNDDGIDTDRIKKVDETNSLKEIREVYSSLCLKNDRKRYCTMAEELILLFAKGLGWIFDGQRKWFGQEIDMRGWDETVKIKLKRMRYDTSTFVAGVMRDYQMSSGTRIMMELIPSAFMYSSTRKSDNNGTNLEQPAQKVDWSKAMDDIGGYD